jgi:aldehyde dehydrogenase (NAD+)
MLGKSPNIVFGDANLDQAVTWSSMAIFFNHGQSCIAGSRLYVHSSIHDEFVSKFIEIVNKIKVGSQMDESTEMGPLVDDLQFKKVMAYISIGIDQGATVACGGSRIGSQGYFVQPTVFTNVKSNMTICKEEIFGPVVCILKFDTMEEVIQLANDTEYGLGAGTFF